MNIDRQEKIVELRNQGKSLQEIGLEVGLTGERVRQILKSQWLRVMRREDRIEQAITRWQASGELKRPYDVAVENGLNPHGAVLARLRRACSDLVLPDTKSGGSRWSRETVAEALRRVALEHGLDLSRDWMRMSEYAAWKHPDDPSTATIGANYLWSDLMELAGFDLGNAHRRGRKPGVSYQSFDDDAIDEAVLAYVRARPAKLSAKGLESFLASNPELPSMATIRNRARRRGIGSLSGIITDVTGRHPS